jgi:hypothetical protein
MSVFDASSFMETTVKTELSTQFPVIPEGEYLAQVKDIKLRQVDFKKIAGSGIALDVMWEILDDGVKAATKMDHPQCRQDFLLDLVEGSDPPQLDLAEARNIRLGQILAACGLNSKKGWNLNMIKNQTCGVRVKHRDNPDDPEAPFSEVSRVVSLDKFRETQDRKAVAA